MPVPDEALTIPLPPLPAGARLGGSRTHEGRTLREHKEHLRETNAGRARDIARHTGLTHAKVNAELNRPTGLRKVSDATVEQRERRLRKADEWLRRVKGQRAG